jgi:NADPH:quinone reductase-like Zn-dependent oxidoreductase
MGVHLLHLGSREPVLRTGLDRVFDGIGKGELKPVLDRTFPLTRDGAVEAHRYLHDRRNLGKVTLTRP